MGKILTTIGIILFLNIPGINLIIGFHILMEGESNSFRLFGLFMILIFFLQVFLLINSL